MRDARLTQPEHGQEQLVESSVGQTILVGLRQSWAIGQPGYQRGIAPGPEPADGQHLGHLKTGAPCHESQIGLMLDLLQTIENERGPESR